MRGQPDRDQLHSKSRAEPFDHSVEQPLSEPVTNTACQHLWRACDHPGCIRTGAGSRVDCL